ncbi:hypothetical protein H2199_002898 [Coniosporium tulheliwenetii]|uniref:Uncharacterized protein n=1 Tax=Coniosporium tulheliwenetii TaxID=3383036 RepID=A0ACC2ZE38_9PEZI|nr:hypothetical protein H2199_002898 [Cladosporium sp. JES 115]
MPHTGRKNRKPPPRNRKPTQVALENGWNLITRSKSSARPDMERETLSSKGAPWNVYSEGPTIEGLTLRQLGADFARHEEQYLASNCSQVIRRHIEKVFGRDGHGLHVGPGGRITNAVCLALGSLCCEHYNRNGRFWQLAMFMDIVKQLRQHHNDIDAFIQEPALRPLDVEFLKSLGLTVLEDPAAARVIQRTSFVYAPCMYAPHLLCEILAGKDPALFINPDLAECIKGWQLTAAGDRTEETIRNAQRFEDGWHKERIPEPETSCVPFPSFRIYWKDADPPSSPTAPP